MKTDIFLSLPAIICSSCRTPCTGEVLKVQDKHFHINCFKCHGKIVIFYCFDILLPWGYSSYSSSHHQSPLLPLFNLLSLTISSSFRSSPLECGTLLASGGYFPRNNQYFCSKDYHKLFGTKCKSCGDFVEGRVITALGNSYHPQCFTCDRCQ